MDSFRREHPLRPNRTSTPEWVAPRRPGVSAASCGPCGLQGANALLPGRGSERCRCCLRTRRPAPPGGASMRNGRYWGRTLYYTFRSSASSPLAARSPERGVAPEVRQSQLCHRVRRPVLRTLRALNRGDVSAARVCIGPTGAPKPPAWTVRVNAMNSRCRPLPPGLRAMSLPRRCATPGDRKVEVRAAHLLQCPGSARIMAFGAR